jgi:hypothetical protein
VSPNDGRSGGQKLTAGVQTRSRDRYLSLLRSSRHHLHAGLGLVSGGSVKDTVGQILLYV